MHETKHRLLDAGLLIMLERGYNAMGIQQLLEATGLPRGSFYHHFRGKEDFALQVIELYAGEVSALLDDTLLDHTRPPLDRIRAFFEATIRKYEQEGYLGCFLGALGQELSGESEVFRAKIEACLDGITARMAQCLEEARCRGDLTADTDTVLLADVLVDSWEGAALRSRLRRDRAPLDAVLNFYLRSAAIA